MLFMQFVRIFTCHFQSFTTSAIILESSVYLSHQKNNNKPPAKEIDEEALIKKFIEGLQKDNLPVPDQDTLLRFLVGWSWDLNKAHETLKDTIKWREATKPDTTPCPDCTKDPYSHCMRVVGFDTLKRPVIYVCYGQTRNRSNQENNVIHLCKLLEDTIKLMKNIEEAEKEKNKEEKKDEEKKKPSDLVKGGKWVWVIDFEDFGLSDCSPSGAKLTSNLLTHYPERLGMLILVDPPFIFDAAWTAIKGLLPDETLAKIKMLSKPAHLKNHADLFGEELYNWLVAEVKENRESKIAKTKAYWEWRTKEGEPKKHDPRGIASYVNSKYYVSPVDPKFCQSLSFEKKP